MKWAYSSANVVSVWEIKDPNAPGSWNTSSQKNKKAKSFSNVDWSIKRTAIKNFS